MQDQQDTLFHIGYLSMLAKNGKTFGYLNINFTNYSLRDIGDGDFVLAKIDSIPQIACHSPYVDSSDVVDENIAIELRSGGGNCRVRVLALYSSKADDESDDINQVIDRNINAIEVAIKRSAIQESDLQIHFVGKEKIVDYVETLDVGEDFKNLRSGEYHNENGVSTTELRDIYQADIVVIFAQGRNRSWLIAGLAGNTRLLGDEGAWVLVDLDYTDDPSTCVHEIGHIFQADHEACDGPGEGIRCITTGPGTIYYRGHYWKPDPPLWGVVLGGPLAYLLQGRIKTVMYSEVAPRTILNFSNPNVKFGGDPTGVDDGSRKRDNARRLRALACTVADYRFTSYPLISSIIAGSSFNPLDAFFACPCSSKSLSATVSGGAPGPYTYVWSYGIDGINWENLASTGNVASVFIPCDMTSGNVFVRVLVTSSDGLESTSIARLDIVNGYLPSGQGCPMPITVDVDGIQSIPPHFNIFPNPSSGGLSISYTLEYSGKIQFYLVTLNGKEIVLCDEVCVPGTFIKNFTLDLPAGIYTLGLRYNSATYYKLVTIK